MSTKVTKSIVSIILLLSLLLSALYVTADTTKEKLDENELLITQKDNSYIKYKSEYSNNQNGNDTVNIDIKNYKTDLSKFVETEVFDDKFGIVTNEESSVCWDFDIKNEGLYNITITYRSSKDGLSEIQRELTLDGQIPFEEANDISFSKVYSCDGKANYDLQGNEIRSNESEKHIWQTVTLFDIGGYTEENYCFYLSKEKHTIGFSGGMGELSISGITIHGIKNYEKYINKNDKNNDDLDNIKIQAEKYIYKSNSGILTRNDRSSYLSEPSSPIQAVYNTIGGDSWSSVGQWIEWQVDVKKAGYYNIGLRYRQNTKIGGISSRMITIDGKLPFKEASQLNFKYTNKWISTFLGDETPFKFYLSAGKHSIRLTANCGKMAENLATATDLLTKLNEIYLGIVMVAGATPDLNRDYNFSAQIPEVIKNMKAVSESLSKLAENIKKVSSNEQKVSEIERTIEVLEKMYSDPETIAKQLSNLQSDISAFATWVSDVKRQPLEIDYFLFSSSDTFLKSQNESFFKSLMFKLKQLIGSFTMDYTSIGRTNDLNDKDESLKAWMVCGTEQAQVIQRLINESFIPENSIPVQAQNVAATALMPAILSGNGPDVVMQLDEATPVNYALRGAVYNLNNFKDLNDVLSQYCDCSYESFKLNGDLYALPLTVDYPVLFYRKDIINQLEIDADDFETWEHVLQVVLPKLQTKNLYFGLTASMQSYLMFYYQSGANLYNDKNTEILLSSSKAVNTFRTYSDIYTKYKQKLTFSFVNLFRSGEMPLAVMPYSQYYQLAVFAPEIEHLWDVAKVPGTSNSDGSIDHSVAGTVTGAAILSGSKSLENSWKFLKWWTSGNTQTEYAQNVETVLGIAGRINPASYQARESISWTKDVKKRLDEQLSDCRGVPQVAGSYYVTRYFDFAFRDVVYSGNDICQTLISATDSINEEIKEKTRELTE